MSKEIGPPPDGKKKRSTRKRSSSRQDNPRSQKMINRRTEEINSELNKKAKTFSVPMSPYSGDSAPFRYRADAWENIMTGLGTSRDKRISASLVVSQSNTNHVMFEDLFHGDDIAATACEIPSQEMVRQWINISNDEDEKSDSSEVAEKGSTDSENSQLRQQGGADALATASGNIAPADTHPVELHRDGGPGSGPRPKDPSPEGKARGLSEKAFKASEYAKSIEKKYDKEISYPDQRTERRAIQEAKVAIENAHTIANNIHIKALTAAKEIGDSRGVAVHRQAYTFHREMVRNGETNVEFPPRRYNEDSLVQRDDLGYLTLDDLDANCRADRSDLSARLSYNANLRRMRDLGVHLDSSALPSFIAPAAKVNPANSDGTMIENMRINAPIFKGSPEAETLYKQENPTPPTTDPDVEENKEEMQSVGKSTLLFLEFLEAQTKVYESLVWSKVFGGSLLFMGINDGGGDNPMSMARPLNEENIISFDFLSVFDRWDVDVYTWYRDPRHPKFGLPETYRIRQTASAGGTDSSLAGDIVHESRCIRFDGTMVNRRRRNRNTGWSDSIFIKLADTIRDFATAYGGVGVLLQDFSQSVFKMKGLYESLIGDGEDVVKKRIQIMDMSKSMVRAVMIDADGEEFENSGRAVSGLSDLLDRFALRLSAATRIPVCLLMGQSPAGLQATGASDIRFFYDWIKSQQEKILRPRLNRLLSLIFKAKNGPTRGKIPKNWSLSFNTLWQSSETETATLRLQVAQTDQLYIENGVLTADEVSKSRFGGDRYSTETVLDESSRSMQKKADDKAKMLEIKHGPSMAPPKVGSTGARAEDQAGESSPFHPPVETKEPGPAREDSADAVTRFCIDNHLNPANPVDRRQANDALNDQARFDGGPGSVPRRELGELLPETRSARKASEEADHDPHDKDSLHQDHIVKRGSKWLLMSVKDSKKVLGVHASRESAIAQEAAIKASQARADAGEPRFDSKAFRERMKKFRDKS